MLEELLAAEELVIGVFHPALAQHLIREVIGVLEDGKPRHQSCRQWWPARLVLIDSAELPFEECPVDRPRQLHQRVAHVDDLIEPRAQDVRLAGAAALLRTHGESPLAAPDDR